MSLRVVLYAEGGRDLGSLPAYVAPGDPIPEESLGPAHLLVRRSLEKARHIPEAAVRFECPLRTARGTVARGSHLLDRRMLRQLLTWPNPKRRPDLAVVLIDMDGFEQRRRDLLNHTKDLLLHPIFGIPRQELEAWLLADGKAIRAVTGRVFDLPQNPEQLAPRRAKERLDEVIGGRAAGLDEHRKKRREIALSCDIDVLRQRCSSFQEFFNDL